MGKEVRLFKSEERRSRAGVSDFLRDLADKVGAGQVTLRQGEEQIILQIPEKLVLEIQVEDEDKGSKGLEHSLEIELAWYEGDERGGPVELG